MRFALLFVLLASPLAAAPPVVSLAYRADGKLLAAGAGGSVALVVPATGEVTSTLPQSGRVTAVAFSKANVLAVASGEPGKTGVVRLYDSKLNPKPIAEIPAHRDAIYALAFSPDGGTLATAGYDRVIKLWSVAKPDKPTHVLQDHSDAVYSVAFHPNGKLLASGSADRAVKVWDTATGQRLYTLGDPTDWVYAVDWSPDGSKLAAGGVDKSIRVWNATAEGGKLVNSVFAHTRGVLKLLYSPDGGTLYSVGEDAVVKNWDTAKMVERKVFAKQPDVVHSLALRLDGTQLALGRHDGVGLFADPATGANGKEFLPAKPKPANADRFPTVRESGSTDSARAAMVVKLPATIHGSLDRAGDTDYFAFDAKAGDEIGVQVVRDKSKLDPRLALVDADGQIVAESDGDTLGFKVSKDSRYAIAIRDKDYRGGTDFTYRLNVGDVPVVTSVFPLAVPKGKAVDVHVDGVNLGPAKPVRVTVPMDAAVGSRIPVNMGGATIAVAEFPSTVVADSNTELRSLPASADGILAKPGDAQTIKFTAKKGVPLVVEVHARRLGSPLDSSIEILDAAGAPLGRATLRCVAKTYSVFRDNDSATSGIRIENWNELAMNDYLYVGTELMRIAALPKGPDDDCQFVSRSGQRLGYLGTTPTHHYLGNVMYKVEIHPPGTTFPPNGMPVFPIAWRNDDGGPGFGKDSMLMFDPPADGTYQVRVADARGQGGPAHAYRLTVRPPRPDYSIDANPKSPAVWKGNGVPITVTANRVDGFEGPIQVKLLGLPPGLAAPATFIEAEQVTTTFTLFANADAPPPSGELKLEATATIAGQPVTRILSLGTPKLVEPGDLITTVSTESLRIEPGKETKFKVSVERRNGFKGRVPLDVRGLPHGVRVLNIGLNGILLTERDAEREVVLYAEPWVKPMTHPICVLSRRESTGKEFAARPVRLTVAGPPSGK
jgi:WD40 repeat protein